MDRYTETFERGRYRKEDGKIIIDVAVHSPRQLFNERDPAPFRARDLDSDFVNYVLSSIQEFPHNTDMKLRISVLDGKDPAIDSTVIGEAIRSHFLYESKLIQTRLRKQRQSGRFFFFIGLFVLFVCLGLAQLIDMRIDGSVIGGILREGLVIVGWVAMWRPIEVVLYDWWPLRELRQFIEKAAALPLEIIFPRNDQPS